jgi:hypothetical protein
MISNIKLRVRSNRETVGLSIEIPDSEVPFDSRSFGGRKMGGRPFIEHLSDFSVEEETLMEDGRTLYKLAGRCGPFATQYSMYLEPKRSKKARPWLRPHIRAKVEGEWHNLYVGAWSSGVGLAARPGERFTKIDYKAEGWGNIWHTHISEKGLKEALLANGMDEDWATALGHGGFTPVLSNPQPKLEGKRIYSCRRSGGWGASVRWKYDHRVSVGQDVYLGAFPTEGEARKAVELFEAVGKKFTANVLQANPWSTRLGDLVAKKAASLSDLEKLVLGAQ